MCICLTKVISLANIHSARQLKLKDTKNNIVLWKSLQKLMWSKIQLPGN